MGLAGPFQTIGTLRRVSIGRRVIFCFHLDPSCESCFPMKTLPNAWLATLVLLAGIETTFAPVVSGVLQVDILPPAAVAAGAQWTVDGPLPVRDSGTYTVVAVGTHTVYFTDVAGWITPASLDVTISQGQTNFVTGTYTLSNSAPILAVALTPTNAAVISWPSPSTGWNVEQNADLTTTNWIAPPETINDDGTNRFIIVSPPVGSMFFRLRQ